MTDVTVQPRRVVPRSPVYVLVNDRLEGRLPELLREWYEAGRSLRDMSLELARQEGVKVSHEAIRSWCNHLGITESAA